MKDDMPLKCEIRDGAIDMAIGRNVLVFAAENHPYFYDPDANPDGPNIKVIDSARFTKDVIIEINREGEDGSTLLTDLLDEAIKRAVESGSEGIDHDA